MTEQFAIDVARTAFVTALEIGGPLLAASLAIGMLVSIFQAVTQINEQTLSFVPKIITVAGVAFGSLLSGTVLVENIFSWPGVGQYAYRSAVNLDLPAIMGVSLFVALVYIVVNLVVDLLYGVIDPRIRLS